MKRYIGQGGQGSQAKELQVLWNSGAAPSLHVDGFTTKKLSNPLCLGFLWGFHYIGMVDKVIGHWGSNSLSFPEVCWKWRGA